MTNKVLGVKTRVLIGSALAVTTATAAYAATLTVTDLSANTSTNQFITIDIDGSARVDRPGTSARNVDFILTGSNQRAELRRREQSSGKRTIGGSINVTNFTGDRISVIQALNINGLRARSGSATPIAQLAIRKTSTNNQYEFYIVQDDGQPTCTNLGTLTVNTAKSLSVEYENGKAPIFRSGTGSCTTTDSGDAKIHNSANNYYYYGKLGAYHTSTGTGAATVKWTNITDGD